MTFRVRCLVSLVACCLIPVSAFAQGNRIELAIGHSGDDSFRPGQFSATPSSGSYLSGGFSLNSTGQDSSYWKVQGFNLGLDTSHITASLGRYGSFDLGFDYKQIPQSEIRNARSPFKGYGTSSQRLPAGWVPATSTSGFSVLNSALNEFDVDKKRQRFNSKLSWRLDSAWELTSEYRHETKEGNDVLGAIFGSSGGNPRGALLARPIDFTTDEVSIGVDYATARTQYGVSYNIMYFENDDPALRWDNPFNNPQWLAGAGYSSGAVGQLALEPDNESMQVNFYAGHNFTPGTRITASVSRTSLQQDEDFLPFSSVIAAPAMLPRQTLDGEVETLNASLGFSSRLGQRSTLRVRYNYRDRDNQTEQAVFRRVAGDSAAQATLSSDGARVNRIYDQAVDRLSIDLDYRFSSTTRAALGYEVEENDRSMLDVESTTEQTSFFKLDIKPFSVSSGWVKLTHAERDVSGYDTTRPLLAGHSPEYLATLIGTALFRNDPFLRRFHVSPRDRDELSAALNIYPSDLIAVSLLTRLSDDDYPTGLVGLRHSRTRMLSADLSYLPDADWSAGLFYNFENYRNKQSGYSRSGGASPTPAYPVATRDNSRSWQMHSEDLVHTAGGSLDRTLMGGRLVLSLDATITKAVTESDPYSSGLAWLPYPDIKTDITSLAGKLVYQLSPGRELRLRYFHERFRSADYALDNVLINTLANVLLLGNESPEFTNNVWELSVVLALP